MKYLMYMLLFDSANKERSKALYLYRLADSSFEVIIALESVSIIEWVQEKINHILHDLA